MPISDPLIFLVISVVTMIGFVLKALSNYNPERTVMADTPLVKTVSQTIFLAFLTLIWIFILFG